MSAREPTAALPGVAGAVLESLYQHRLLSSGQLHRMHMPDASLRWTRRVLTGLRSSGLVSFLRAADGEGSVYFLTSEGARAVESIASRTLARGKLITAEQAAGPLRAHTLAVNETGIAFMQAARERGDDFGALAWQHEIAHPVGARRGNLLIADALLSYLRYGEDGELIFETRLLELDRGTLPTDALAGSSRVTRASTSTPQPGRAHQPGKNALRSFQACCVSLPARATRPSNGAARSCSRFVATIGS
jgi:hypothetical protein